MELLQLDGVFCSGNAVEFYEEIYWHSPILGYRMSILAEVKLDTIVFYWLM